MYIIQEKTDKPYITPDVTVLEIKTEGVICGSILEDLEEDEGDWGKK